MAFTALLTVALWLIVDVLSQGLEQDAHVAPQSASPMGVMLAHHGAMRHILLVTAHPDDEAMFFSPLLAAVQRHNELATSAANAAVSGLQPITTSLLCLTAGAIDVRDYGFAGAATLNATATATDSQRTCNSTSSAGRGTSKRVFELYSSMHAVWGLRMERIHILDVPALPDALDATWDVGAVKAAVVKHVEHLKEGVKSKRGYCMDASCDEQFVPPVDAVFTFDEKGVSGHVNHRDTFRGVLASLPHLHKGMRVFSLQSRPLTPWGTLAKYSGPVQYASALAFEYIHGAAAKSVAPSPSRPFNVVMIVNPAPWATWQAMSWHKSQWEPVLMWYRRLSVLCSQYTYLNEFVPLSANE